jgi:hypothetical protein
VGPGDTRSPDTFAPKNYQIQWDLFLGMIENRITPDLSRFDVKTSQCFCFALVINEHIAFGSDQKGDAFPRKLHQQSGPSIAAVHDEKRSTLHRKAAHRGQNQGMLQNVSTLLNHWIREAREGDWKVSFFKDQSNDKV